MQGKHNPLQCHCSWNGQMGRVDAEALLANPRSTAWASTLADREPWEALNWVGTTLFLF